MFKLSALVLGTFIAFSTSASTHGGGVLLDSVSILKTASLVLDSENFQTLNFNSDSNELNTLTCEVKDDARENAGLPLYKLFVNLDNQVTSLYHDNNIDVQFVTLDKVGSKFPNDREKCILNSSFNEEKGAGLYNFKCPMVTVSFQYSLASKTGFFGEKFKNITRAFAVKNCELSY